MTQDNTPETENQAAPAQPDLIPGLPAIETPPLSVEERLAALETAVASHQTRIDNISDNFGGRW